MNNLYPKVLFYAANPYVFRSTPIGYLYEIAQVYPVVLLSEKLDPETVKILKNKDLFPKLEGIIPVGQYTERRMSNKDLFKLAKDVIYRYKPDIVIADNDLCSFEMYLMRFAKKINALKITIQPSNVAGSVIAEKWIDLINSYLRFPQFLPLWLRLFFVKCRKYLGHFRYYWFWPLMVGEKPFWGKSSYLLRRGNSGMRDSDHQIVFSKRDYNIYLKDGVPAEKLYILSHPLNRKTKEFFKVFHSNKSEKRETGKKCATLMLPEVEFGFRRKNCSLISKEERKKNWIKTIKLIAQTLPDWEIYIKMHPDIKNIEEKKKSLGSISQNIRVPDPQEPADKYIELGDVIIGLPLSASTALFTAALQCPEKPIISLDLHQELLGDTYKDFTGIEYVDNKEKFVNVLKTIYNGKYLKKPGSRSQFDDFSDAAEALEFFYRKKNNAKQQQL